MMSRMHALFVLLAGVSIAHPAAAALVHWDFAGMVVAGPSSPAVRALVQANDSLGGTFVFDDGAAAVTPGTFSLPSAHFHAVANGLVVDTFGATATVWPNQDGITFSGEIASLDPELPGTRVRWDLFSETYIDGYYSPGRLPDHLGPNDQGLIFWFSGGEVGSDAVSTDTNFGTWRVVPEPSPLSLYFGTGVILISMRRLRGSSGLVLRGLAAPSPLAVSRVDAIP